MKLNSCKILILGLSVFLPAAFSSPTAEIKTLVSTCTGCHGPEGVSMNPLWPNLAGQKKDYLAKQLLAFKNNERKDPLMNPISMTISEKDIDSIATYFSELK